MSLMSGSVKELGLIRDTTLLERSRTAAIRAPAALQSG
jgi:hypothetical protein